ncbi:two-component system sensor kinase [Lentzea sp. NBRC 105346]|uniref:sensor histidine kinase n=1 Tax=Lentzea sp. NBRC 105346 TaxID=3032205 RepID=UPI002555C9F0|nr:ATP-binding protein [Lentzea sp. NBRC 105346]GLZ30369.1 two-component system sensor kinase [Lentzea sp. NBRC 105346]
MIGAAQERTLATGRRFALYLRTTVLLCLCVVAMVQRPHLAIAIVAVWGVVFFRTKAVATDTAVIAALGLAQTWVVPPEVLADSRNWVLAAVSITAVAHQWFTSTAQGVAITTVLVAATMIGGTATEVPIVLWTFAEAAMSRAVFLLVLKGARQADRAAETAEKARRAAAVTAARRADEREHLAVLHDTAAATLFAVGAGMVDGDEPWLAERARRDIEALKKTWPEGEVDLIPLLDEVIRHAPVKVDLKAPPSHAMPSAAAIAICGSVREALTNVARHAGVGVATVSIDNGDRLVVEIADAGRGFDTAEISPHRRGISMSIVDRMTSAGGTAEISTGTGTRVTLEWPHG